MEMTLQKASGSTEGPISLHDPLRAVLNEVAEHVGGCEHSEKALCNPRSRDQTFGVHISARGSMQAARLLGGAYMMVNHCYRFRVRVLIEVGFALSGALGGGTDGFAKV